MLWCIKGLILRVTSQLRHVAENKKVLESVRERRSRQQVMVDSLRKQQAEKEKEIKSKSDINE